MKTPVNHALNAGLFFSISATIYQSVFESSYVVPWHSIDEFKQKGKNKKKSKIKMWTIYFRFALF